MRAVVCEKPGRMVVRELPVPKPGRDEVLVQVKAAAICGSDFKTYKGVNLLARLPLVLGHEFSGIVERVGEGVTDCSQGDKVIVEPSFICRKCFFCSRKEYHLCDNLLQIGQQLPGAFAEYTVASAPFVYPMPENISFQEASLAQPLAIATHAVDRSGVKEGDFAAILGGGAIGQLVAQVSKHRGARILTTDVFDQKLEMARAMGADYTLRGDDPGLTQKVLTLTGQRGPDIVFEAAGSSPTIGQSIEMVRKGGTVVLIGVTGHKSEDVPLDQTVFRELRLVGTIRYAPGDYEKAIAMLSSGVIQVKPLIERTFFLGETPRVFEEILASPEGVFRAVMVTEKA
jgi:2-desacetyl-2-hydroxyethyl bacteriochlorophyllide A dehydrogenase